MLKVNLKEEGDWKKGFSALLLSGSAIAVFALFQKITHLGLPTPWDLEGRTTSFFGYPNAAGLFLAPLVSASLVIIARHFWNKTSSNEQWILASIFLALALPAIFFCQTEAAYIAIPAGIFFTLLLSPATKKQKILLSLVVLGFASIAWFTSSTIREKLTLSDTSGITRKTVWAESITMLREHPILGAGLAGYPSVMTDYHTTGYYEIFQYPHNILLNIWSELGLLGLIAFLWLSWVVLSQTYRGLQNKYVEDSFKTTRYLIAFTALATMTVHGLVDVPYFKNDLAMMAWFLLALFP